MAAQILQTKLNIPLGRQQVIGRPQLIERLNQGLQRKLTLVSAPAGSGKTCLISAWSQCCERLFAWLSLDQQDNEATTFLTYLGAALQRAHPDLENALQPALQILATSAADSAATHRFVTDLLNSVTQLDAPLVLVLDDYHEIRALPDHQILSFLLDHLPANLHLVIVSREDPPLPLARMRGHQELTEIRAADLRFSTTEIGDFLQQVMGMELIDEHIALLEERTEGWIAGIQLVALALHNRTDPAPFVLSFAREERYVMDYLMDEVVKQQPPSIQRFLLNTSILERLCSSLCDALCADPPLLEAGQSSQDIIDALEQANLFIIPLDTHRYWYRYHHLFAELLRHRLRRIMPAQIPQLHSQASIWYEENGFVIEAMRHALTIDDVDRVVALMEKNVLDIAYSGELATLLTWMRSVPSAVVRSRPLLCIAYGWAYTYAGQLQTAEGYVQDAQTAMAQNPDADARYVSGQTAAIRAYRAALSGQMGRAVQLAQHALAHLVDGDPAHGFTQLLLASALSWSGQLQAAAKAYETAMTASLATGNISIQVDFLCDMTRLQGWQGRLHAAAQSCRNAIAMAEEQFQEGGEQSPETGYAYLRLSAILREWNQKETALELANRGIAICAKWGQANILTHCYFELAQVRQAFGDLAGARQAVQQANLLAAGLSPWFGVRAQGWQARIQLLQGDLKSAVKWQQGNMPDPDHALKFELIDNYFTVARILISQGQQPGASPSSTVFLLLDRLADLAEECGATGYLIEALALQALAAWNNGNPGQALAALERALTLARPEGYIRLFVDLGESMVDLFWHGAEQGIDPAYIGQLLAVLNSEIVFAPPELVEPLSVRELEVLRLLAIGLSNNEIAQQLVVTLGTVKSHISHIYQKLSVNSRTQAVARAQEIHLI